MRFGLVFKQVLPRGRNSTQIGRVGDELGGKSKANPLLDCSKREGTPNREASCSTSS